VRTHILALLALTLTAATQAQAQSKVQLHNDWAARCEPKVVSDKYGVDRYVYQQAGCEYGIGLPDGVRPGMVMQAPAASSSPPVPTPLLPNTMAQKSSHSTESALPTPLSPVR
jgi:hypothetical protein